MISLVFEELRVVLDVDPREERDRGGPEKGEEENLM